MQQGVQAGRKNKKNLQAYRGLINLANTCYANSILQVLFYLRPLRKIICTSPSTHKTIAALKNIFFQLMVEDSDPVDPGQLIYSYDKLPNPLNQQDIHQFMHGFIQQLQLACAQLKQFWQGKSNLITTSIEEGKHYKSQVSDVFTELQLHIINHQGKAFQNVLDSLHSMIAVEIVDDLLQTDQWGKIKVQQRRQYQSLPDVLFLNVKRYEYLRQSGRLHKICNSFAYPTQLDIGFMMQTPGAQEHIYQLYAVTVHLGLTPYSGHYISFVNVSESVDRPFWMKFDDSRVNFSSQQQVLQHKGGIVQGCIQDHLNIVIAQKETNQTAYLLVYIRKCRFDQYQSTHVSIPKDWKPKCQRMLPGDQAIEIDVGILPVGGGSEIDLFDHRDTCRIQMARDGDIKAQLIAIQRNFLGIQIDTIWKVSKATQRIIRLYKLGQTTISVGRVFTYKKGHNIPDYLLVVPKNKGIYGIEEWPHTSALGIVKLQQVEGQSTGTDKHTTYQIVAKRSLNNFLDRQVKKRQKKAILNIKDEFQQDWNDYCTITFNQS